MSKTASRRFKKWDELVKDAAHEPWTDTINGREIVIEQITGDAILKIQENPDNVANVLAALCGEDDAAHVVAAWKDAPAQVLAAYLQQVMDFFGISDGQGN